MSVGRGLWNCAEGDQHENHLRTFHYFDFLLTLCLGRGATRVGGAREWKRERTYVKFGLLCLQVPPNRHLLGMKGNKHIADFLKFVFSFRHPCCFFTNCTKFECPTCHLKVNTLFSLKWEKEKMKVRVSFFLEGETVREQLSVQHFHIRWEFMVIAHVFSWVND